MLGQSGEISISGERDVCVIQPIFTLSAVMNLTAASIGKLIIAVSIPLSALLILFYGTLPNIAKIELLIHFIFGSIFLLPFLLLSILRIAFIGEEAFFFFSSSWNPNNALGPSQFRLIALLLSFPSWPCHLMIGGFFAPVPYYKKIYCPLSKPGCFDRYTASLQLSDIVHLYVPQVK